MRRHIECVTDSLCHTVSTLVGATGLVCVCVCVCVCVPAPQGGRTGPWCTNINITSIMHKLPPSYFRSVSDVLSWDSMRVKS